jgi:2-dehydro-3-deoxygluconokinase
MGKIATFGEIMLRLSPPGYLRLHQTNSFDVIFGGAEANVSVSLANYGLDPVFISAVPNNPIGDAALNSLRWFGVDTSKVLRQGERLGIYYCEKGAAMRPSKVVYDRKYSSISAVKAGDFDWDKALDGVTWLHWTGITPALSDGTAAAVLEAVKAAKAKGITISCDLNYRKNLWSREKAGQVMGELVPYVDVLIANEEDAADVFGIHADATDINSGKLSVDGYKSVAKQLVDRFGVKKVGITLRESLSASDNNWSGLLYDGATGEVYTSKKYSIHIVDRVGGGDSFGAGLIFGLTNGYDNQQTIEFAAAASALKHTVEGDYNFASLPEVQALMGGNASGRVQR